MKAAQLAPVTSYQALSDNELVELAVAGDRRVFRTMMQRHNRRLYRVARAILGQDAEAEDVVQETYIKAFENLGRFRGESALSTWLTKIAINEALGRKRKIPNSAEFSTLEMLDEQGGQAQVLAFPGVRLDGNPETNAGRTQIRRLIEHALDALPDAFRTVFVLREIEQMSVAETAAFLKLRPETVKTRLHRARRLLRERLEEALGSALHDAYGFDGERCERLTKAVLARLTAGA